MEKKNLKLERKFKKKNKREKNFERRIKILIMEGNDIFTEYRLCDILYNFGFF